jgi:FtsP/CotA-like multicopper oxidase with cupredoxin domain
VELVVDFADRPGASGDWLYHCHILEHAEAGMMGEARVR